jgi:hypothetical protein
MTRFALFWLAAVLVMGGEPAKAPAASRVLRVPLSVASDSTLTSKDFSAFVYGADSAKIARIRTPDDDLVLLVVMDVVGDLALVDPARYALAARVRELPSNVYAGVMRAQEGLRVLLDPTADRDAFESAILNMPVAGKAGLLDTIATASRIAESVGAKSGVRVAILYVTDSDVRNYREDFTNPVINSSDSRDLSRKFPEGLIREKISRTDESLAIFQTPVFIVHIAYSASQLNEAYQTGLLQLATTTGASATFCRSSAEIPAAIGAAVSQIVSQYRVHVQLPSKVPRSVSVSLSSGDRPLTYRTRFTLR